MSRVLASGNLTNTASYSYTATENCICYFTCYMQANNGGGYQIKLNNVEIVNMPASEAVPVGFFTCPIIMYKGDVCYMHQTSNRTGQYKVIAFR